MLEIYVSWQFLHRPHKCFFLLITYDINFYYHTPNRHGPNGKECRCNAESSPSLFLVESNSIWQCLFSSNCHFFIVDVFFFSQKVLLPCTILFDMQTVRPTTAPAVFNSIVSLIVRVSVRNIYMFDQPTKRFNVYFIHYELSTMLCFFCIHSFKCFTFFFEKFAVELQEKRTKKIQKLII